jgi:hypothetical protein
MLGTTQRVAAIGLGLSCEVNPYYRAEASVRTHRHGAH